jgi:lipopolysaccharide export system protein LptA
MRGERLVVNLTDGVSRMEGGRVEGIINPKSNSDQKSEQKSAPGQPSQPARKK